MKMESDQLITSGLRWKRESFLQFSRTQAALRGIAASNRILTDATLFATEPDRFIGARPSPNTALKYKRLWSDLIDGNDLIHHQIESAFNAYILGDDSLFKSLTPNRREWFLVEFGKQMAPFRFGQTIPTEWRSRKFHTPIYLTPAGVIHSFPESIEDSFLDYSIAKFTIERYSEMLPSGLDVRICSTKIGQQVHQKAYRRWLTEVKSSNDYKEPRRTLEEVFAMYISGGITTLKNSYSPSYVYALLRRFRDEKLISTTSVDEDLQGIKMLIQGLP